MISSKFSEEKRYCIERYPSTNSSSVSTLYVSRPLLHLCTG